MSAPTSGLVAVALIATAAGCQGCTAPGPRDAARDGSDAATTHDVRIHMDDGRPGFPSDAGPDVASLWPYRTVDLQLGPPTTLPAGECAGARRLMPGSFSAAQTVFSHGGGLYLPGLARIDLTTWGAAQVIGARPDLSLLGVPLGSGIAVAIYDQSRYAPALVYFAGLPGRGTVVWDPLSPRIDGTEESGGGIMELVGTEALVAWTWRQGTTLERYHLWVAGARGENAREVAIPGGAPPHYLHASGPRLVFDAGEDLWLWDIRTGGAPENLTQTPTHEWHPWLDGDRLVWVDQRDTPTGGLWRPDNPEIYTMDLRTRVPERLTHDPPDRPVVQHAPVVRGDWIIWMDFRNAAQPNPPNQFLTDRMEIWGYHLPTRREHPIFTGDIQAYYPALIDGQVVFPCVSADRRGGIFITPLPSVD